MKKIYYMLLLAVLAVTMVSCDGWDSPYRVESIVGSWESYYGYNGVYEYDILGRDVVRYDFYANYTGRYTYYDTWYGLCYVDFDWETYSDRLIIRYYDGDSDYLFYGFDNAGYLIMSLDRRYTQYTASRPAGYWSPAKDLNQLKGKSIEKKDVSKSVSSRAVKAESALTKAE